MSTIGFIGASGLMGHGIAENLQARGDTRCAWSSIGRRDTACDLFEAARSRPRRPPALAADCDTIFLCVTGSPESRRAARQGRRAAGSPPRRAGPLIVDCGTSEPASTARLARAVPHARRGRSVDARSRAPPPRRRRSADGDGWGREADFTRIEPLLR
jgi:3-hydroxyisobutyrate dehydrogenase-like beta-hydroxyacid dehydrogenase